jgi:hypothetical protein
MLTALGRIGKLARRANDTLVRLSFTVAVDSAVAALLGIVPARFAPRTASGTDASSRWARILVSAWAALAALAALPTDARANCAMPTTYEVMVAGNTVTICPQNFEGRGCPDPDGMLRSGGSGTVRIADRCSDDAGPESCYVDECVPKGDYQYGFARPYECCEYCCSTHGSVAATVTQDLTPECAPPDAGARRDAGNVADASDDDAPGYYLGGGLICRYVGGGGRGGSGGFGGSAGFGGANTGGSGGAAGSNGNAMGGEAGTNPGGSPSEAASDGCSCRTVKGSSSAELVLAANGVLVLLGLFLARRR